MARLEDYIAEVDANVKNKFSEQNKQENEGSSLNSEQEETNVVEQQQQQEQSVVEEAQQQQQNEEEQTNVVTLNGEGNNESSSMTIVNEDSSIDESKVLSFLSQKLGREINSIDDLTKKEQSNLDPEVESFVKWSQETGYKDPMLWKQTQQTDFKSLDDKSIIIEDYILNKGLNREEAELYYERNYGEEVLDEDLMSEDEISKLQKQNRVKQIDRQLAARESRQRLESLKQKFSQPADGYDKNARGNQSQEAVTQEAKMFWQKSAEAASQELNEFVVPIGDNKGYKFSLGDYAKQKQTSFSDIESFFGEFVDKTTNSWNVNKLIKATALADNMELIAKSIYKQGLSDGAKGVVTSGKNLKFDSTEKSTPDAQRKSQLEDKVKRDMDSLMSKMRGNGLRF